MNMRTRIELITGLLLIRALGGGFDEAALSVTAAH